MVKKPDKNKARLKRHRQSSQAKSAALRLVPA